VAESAGSWPATHRVNNPGQDGYYAELAWEAPETLHAVYTAIVVSENTPTPDDPCPNCSDIFYRRSTNGGDTWSPLTNLSNSPTGSMKPQVAVDPEGRVFVVWEEGYDHYVGRGRATGSMVSVSLDEGASWSTPLPLGATGLIAQQPAIGFDPAGAAIVIWRSLDDTIYYQRSADGGTTWSNPAPLPGVLAREWDDTPFDSYRTAQDSAGRLHLVLVGRAASRSGTGVWHLTWNGQRWSAPDLVSANENYPEWPYIAIGQGNQLHVAWFERSEDDRFRSGQAGVIYHVWYSSRTVDAPSVEGNPPPTPTPVSPPVTPTPTVRPTLPSLGDDTLNRTRGAAAQPNLDNNMTTLLLVSAIPAIILSATIWIARRLRK